MADYGYVYKTTNLINGRIYIGQKKGTINLSYLGSGKLIEKAILKYGKNNFRLEVLAFATTKLMIDGLEMKFIYEYRQVFGNKFLYNITDGGEGFSGVFSEEHKNNISKSCIGRKMSYETRKRMSFSALGKTKSEKTKEKLRIANLGKIMSNETKKKMSNFQKIFIKTQEHKNKISMSHFGIRPSLKTKLKQSLSAKKRWANKVKNVC